MLKELRFLLVLWKVNLLAAMEYRLVFLLQIVGIIVNNATYFLFWVLFFNYFDKIQGWDLNDLFLLFAVISTNFGIAVYFFGNIMSLTTIITNGRLDYYLSLPRYTLLHVLASHSVTSGVGDIAYGLICFGLAGQYSPDTIGRFIMAVVLSTCIFLGFLILIQSLVFWTGNATYLATQVTNALITFSSYPITIFQGASKLFLFTVIPAAFIGSVPTEFVRSFSWENLGLLLLATIGFLIAALVVFHTGLKRYESGSALQTQV